MRSKERRRLFLFLVSISISSGVESGQSAQESEKALAGTPATIDSSVVELRKFDGARLMGFLSDPLFNYHRDPAHGLTWLDKAQIWLWEKGMGFLFSKPMRPFWQLLPYLLVAAAIFFVISRLLKTSTRGLFYNTEQIDLQFSEAEEDVRQTDFTKLIDAAIREKRYRWAVRLLYLNTLRALSENDLIKWKINKTNQQYIAEVSSASVRDSFVNLTRLFEYIWYGEFPIDDKRFTSVMQQFKDFDKLGRGSVA